MFVHSWPVRLAVRGRRSLDVQSCRNNNGAASMALAC